MAAASAAKISAWRPQSAAARGIERRQRNRRHRIAKAKVSAAAGGNKAWRLRKQLKSGWRQRIASRRKSKHRRRNKSVAGGGGEISGVAWRGGENHRSNIIGVVAAH
jgi:hypothetical protein